MNNEKLTQKQRESILLDLSGSSYWQALDSLFKEQIFYAWNALGTLDPFKNPTEVARMQGRLQGYDFLNNEIARIKEQEKEEENKKAPLTS